MKNVVERYARKRIQRLVEFLRSYMESDNLEILHHIRVEIKKIKTLIGLLHFQNRKLDKRHTFKPFRKVFRLAGEIRDPELHRSLALELTGESLIDDPNNAEKKKRFRKAIPGCIQVIQKYEKVIRREARTVTTETYEEYLRQKKNTLKLILNRAYDKSELHPARKLIKNIYYLESIVNPKKSIDLFYTDAARIIGDWHDKMMLIQMLHKSNGKSHAARLHKIEQKGNADLESLRSLVRKFYASGNPEN